MLTRFTTITCPECGHTARPVARDPGSETLHGVLNFVPVAGQAYSAYRISKTELFCAKCNYQLSESIQHKAKDAGAGALKTGMGIAAALKSELQKPRCAKCGAALAAGEACGICDAVNS